MSLYEKLDADLKASMIAKDADKSSVIRFLKSAMKYAAIEKKVEKLSEADALQVIQKQIKQRKESIDQFTKGGRQDLADKEKKEAGLLEQYLPKQLSDSDLQAFVEAEAQKENAAGKKDFGRMMKLLNEKLAGQADSKRISDALGKILR